MAMIQVTFPDDSQREFESGTTGFDIAKSIAPGLAKAAIAVKIDGEIKGLFDAIENSIKLEILTFDNPLGKEVFWHSSSHIMAQAVMEVFPKTKLAIGPAIEEGWYYDFEVEKPFSPADLEKIEKKMSEIVSEKAKFSCDTKSRTDAIEYYKSLDNGEYKVEILEGLEDDTVSFYSHSRFEDLCRGPHIPNTGYIKAFKLIASSGAYWRGDENRQMLQRIYGVSYPKKAMLEEYLTRMEEAKKRDHRVIGRQQELYTISERVGAGLILWRPRGARIRNEIENFWRSEHIKFGYDLVYSPHIANRALWEQSGHTDFYTDDMFGAISVEEKKFLLKPMNCPFHIEMYNARKWSYRDLPLRWAELGTVYRYEKPGVLHGLMRVRGFTQDDAHHFVAQENMEEELVWIINFCVHMLTSFGFKDYNVFLSTRPEKAIGDKEDWNRAEDGLRAALEKAGLPYEVDEGGGAFYGPKIDIQIKDAIGRGWQCSTIQFDFSLPERFDLSYIDSSGQQKRPYMIHRALLGSIERFFGVLIEHYAGNFPLWLAPTQVKVLPITDSVNDYAAELTKKLKENNFRVELDDRSEKVGAKIRDAEIYKVPYMFVIGAREAESGQVSIRRHGEGDIGAMSIDDALAMLIAEQKSKGITDEQKSKS